MKNPFIYLALLLSVLAAPALGASCDEETGDAVARDVKVLNRLKNRDTAPAPSEINRAVTLEAMVAPGDDRRRFRDREGASVTGYVANVLVGGVETVNCHAKDPAHRDTHIELALTAKEAPDETKHVIVEVTPRWREQMAAQGVDWSTRGLRDRLLGRCVRVTGWLLYDKEHEKQSVNTASGNAKVWRASAWEIHPITALDILPSCR